MTLPLLVTSLNPFARLAHQLRCLEAWAALGLEVRTANTGAEAERLVAAGVSRAAIIELDEADTGAALYGKPVPRIAPLLRRLGEDPERAVLLVNSDIYPAMRSAEAVRFWAAQAPALALTREECATLESHRFAANTPYRNGLDAFLFSPRALKATNMMLAEMPVSAQMAFGIPGWDFLLGAVVRSPFVGGRLMDSGVLLHEIHETTYANVDAFAPYLPAMHDLDAATTYTATQAAREFHRIIVAECAAATSLSRLAKAQFYRAPKPAAPSDAARSIALRLCELAPFVGWNYDFAALVALADRRIRSGQQELSADNRAGAGADFGAVQNFFRTGPLGHRLAEDLLAALCHLACRERTAPVRTYPAQTHHALKLETAISTTRDDPDARRAALAALFVADLVEEGVFNAALYKVLALSCQNDGERAILGALLDLCGDVHDDAA
ncbi:hypothetical protein RDV64_23675 (plasmid) [Acuticoccus sp. MNP-M23]|uniref:hypothetical protein n=1 Tax=Acuticoccus sp. MNP-M23 TaxID=3072793 RepID=UPI00281517B3|nr:hypothetical protein [Acuticoccus sp. MNP-M23]WMS45355.1 hypothetical protein RDV64_23675 [Acuticoccus sp. MNP-M23]